jgi:hypothetical protein
LARGPDGWAIARHARGCFPEQPLIHVIGGRSRDWSAQGVPGGIMLPKPYAAARRAAVSGAALAKRDGRRSSAHLLTIVPAYAAALAVLFLVLSHRVIAVRWREPTGFRRAGSPRLERLTRIHANVAEHTPFAHAAGRSSRARIAA